MRKLLVLTLLILPVMCRAEWIPDVKNFRFLETQAGGTPTHWQFFSEGTGTGRCEFVAEGADRYVRVIRETDGDYTGVRQRLDGVTVYPNRDYEIYGSYSTPVEGLAHPCVYYLNENGQFLGAYEFTLPASATKTRFSRKFRPHPGTKIFELQLRAQGKPGEVRFYSCNVWADPGLLLGSPNYVQKAIDLMRDEPSARCAVLKPGADLTLTLLAQTGLEAKLENTPMWPGPEAERYQPVFLDGQAVDMGKAGSDAWTRVCEPRDGRVTVRIAAPQADSRLYIHLRPVKGERLKPLAVEFGGWENGNFAPKAQWIGDSEKLIAEDVDLAVAEALRAIPGGGVMHILVEDSLSKPVKSEIIRRYVIDGEKPVREARLLAAKGESEAFQVIFLPRRDGKSPTVWRIDCDGLKSTGGSIPFSAFKVFRVGYVDSPWGERLPDPLFTDLRMGDPGDLSVLLVEIRVPRDTPAGEYEGTLRMMAGGGKAAVPIRLTVRDFAVPEENHLRTCFWFFRAQIMHHYSLWYEPTWQQASKYLDMALNYRITPIDCNEGRVEPLYKVWREDDGSYSIDWTEFDAYAEYVLARGGNVLHMAPTQWFGKYFSDALKDAYNPQKSLDRSTKIVRWIAPPYLSDEHKKFLQWYLKEACDHFEKKGWLKYAYLQPFDEVGENPEVLSILRTCEEADPRVKILMDVLRPGDSKPMTEMIDIWCPLSPNLPGGGFEQVRKEGDEVWWYVCIGPKKPYANLFTNWSMTEHRQLFWQSWKYQAQGLLYWGLNFWNWWGTEKPYDKATAWPAGKWSSSTTSSDTVGDGYFIYPGPKGPLPSLRLQAMLDGIEDYEYLWLLNDLVKKAEAKGVPASELADARRLLAIPESFCKSLTEYSTDPKDLTSLRDQVAREIERLSRKLKD